MAIVLEDARKHCRRPQVVKPLMSSSHPPRLASLHCLPIALALFALAACESDRAHPTAAESDSFAPAPDKAVPEMRAHGTFFAGQIEVEALLNRAGFATRTKGDADSGDADDNSGSGSGARSGGGRSGGHRRGGGSATSGKGSDGDMAPRIRPSSLQAVALHLRITNHGSTPVEIEVTDFNSDLGNFVVEPSKFSLTPNEPTEADPMISRLGVSSDEIPLVVSLVMSGRTEKQVLALKAVKPVTPPEPAPNTSS